MLWGCCWVVVEIQRRRGCVLQAFWQRWLAGPRSELSRAEPHPPPYPRPRPAPQKVARRGARRGRAAGGGFGSARPPAAARPRRGGRAGQRLRAAAEPRQARGAGAGAGAGRPRACLLPRATPFLRGSGPRRSLEGPPARGPTRDGHRRAVGGVHGRRAGSRRAQSGRFANAYRPSASSFPARSPFAPPAADGHPQGGGGAAPGGGNGGGADSPPRGAKGAPAAGGAAAAGEADGRGNGGGGGGAWSRLEASGPAVAEWLMQARPPPFA
jgi:hypothetical protein